MSKSLYSFNIFKNAEVEEAPGTVNGAVEAVEAALQGPVMAVGIAVRADLIRYCSGRIPWSSTMPVLRVKSQAIQTRFCESPAQIILRS